MEDPSSSVVVQQRSGHLPINGQALADRRGSIILANRERPVTAITLSHPLRPHRPDVVRCTASTADAASGEAPHQERLRCRQVDRSIERDPPSSQDPIQACSLLGGSRKPVEHISALEGLAIQPGRHDLHDQCVRDEPSAGDVSLDTTAQRAASGHLLAEHLPSRDMLQT